MLRCSVLAGLVLAVAGCSGEDRDFDEPQTGGQGGMGGSSGSGGMAGAGNAPPVSCEGDADCDDGAACSGVETCVNGTCQQGEPVGCENPDPAHCAARCLEVDGAGECSVTALDADDDGYFSAACPVDPGEDCDDSNDAAYPMATETCDGVDQDCDGLEDIDEGFPLSGEILPLGGGLAIGYGALAQRFAIADLGAESSIRLLSDLGEPLDAVPWAASAGGDTGIGWLDDSFAVVWGGEAGVQFKRFSPTGMVLTEEKNVVAEAAELPIVLPRGDGWALFWQTPTSAISARAFDVDGVASGDARQIMPTGENLSVATREGQYLVAGNGYEASWVRLSATLAEVGRGTLGSPGTRPVLAATAGGYAAAWLVDGDALVYAELAPDGSVTCGPVPTGFTAPGPSERRRVALARYANGALLLFLEGGQAVALRVATGCTIVGTPIVVADEVTLRDHFQIAAGTRKIVVSWHEPIFMASYYRAFGLNLCD